MARTAQMGDQTTTVTIIITIIPIMTARATAAVSLPTMAQRTAAEPRPRHRRPEAVRRMSMANHPLLKTQTPRPRRRRTLYPVQSAATLAPT